MTKTGINSEFVGDYFQMWIKTSIHYTVVKWCDIDSSFNLTKMLIIEFLTENRGIRCGGNRIE